MEPQINEPSVTITPEAPKENKANEDLPMIVFLSSDNEIVEEFSMDADAAMEALGIKRSRLTQISGKELRVGKIRIDRYTRPVYRPCDIENYKKWTRATASHLNSSKVINEAVLKLNEQCTTLNNLATVTLPEFEAKIEGYLSENTEYLLKENKDTTDSLNEALNKVLNHISSYKENLNSEYKEIQALTKHLLTDIERIVSSQSEISHTLTEVQTSLNEIKASNSENSRKIEITIKSLGKDTSLQVSQLEKSMANIKTNAVSSQAEIKRELGDSFKEIFEKINHLSSKIETSSYPIKPKSPNLRVQRKRVRKKVR